MTKDEKTRVLTLTDAGWKEKEPCAIQMTLDGGYIYHYKKEDDEVIFIDVPR